MKIGELTLPGYLFTAEAARMFRLVSELQGRSGWGFFIAASAPDDPPGVFPGAAGLWAEDEPIPLPDVEDFTGLDFFLPDPGSPETGKAYFVFDAWEGYDVSAVRIQFLERQDARYRVAISALVHNLFEQPTEVRYDGWLQVTSGPESDT